MLRVYTPQVSGLTRLLEGQKDATGSIDGRKENRRETWAPGLGGGGEALNSLYHCAHFRQQHRSHMYPCQGEMHEGK